jgi:hypothetical protein
VLSLADAGQPAVDPSPYGDFLGAVRPGLDVRVAEHRKDRAVRYLRTIGCQASGFISGENLVRAVRSETGGRNYDQGDPAGRQAGRQLAGAGSALGSDSSAAAALGATVDRVSARPGCAAPHALVLVRRPRSPYRSGRWKRSQHPDHQIRSHPCGHPDPFRTVRDLGRVPARCSSSSGFPKGCSPRWLPAWLPRRRVHGSGGRFCDLANLARCLLGLDHSSLGWLRSFRAYSGSWILPP